MLRLFDDGIALNGFAVLMGVSLTDRFVLYLNPV